MTNDGATQMQELAKEIADKWLDKGPTPEGSWVVWTPTVASLGFSDDTMNSVRASLPDHLHQDRLVQVGGQRRRVFCVRLADGFGWAMMRLDSPRIQDPVRRNFVQQCQLYLAQILTQALFGSGDRKGAAASAAAIFGEATGYTLPMFTSPATDPPRPEPTAKSLAQFYADVAELLAGVRAELDALKGSWQAGLAQLVQSQRASEQGEIDSQDVKLEIRAAIRIWTLVVEEFRQIAAMVRDFRARHGEGGDGGAGPMPSLRIPKPRPPRLRPDGCTCCETPPGPPRKPQQRHPVPCPVHQPTLFPENGRAA
jgi:hypothetical protein